MKLRGHLRACAGCPDFEAALRHRPAHLTALTPELTVGARRDLAGAACAHARMAAANCCPRAS